MNCTPKNKRGQDKSAKNVQIGWPKILADAQAALRENKALSRALRRSIRIIETKLARGEECPAYLSTQN